MKFVKRDRSVARRTMQDTWRNMLKRCQDPSNIGYHNYGGRGIKVCERWQIFDNFLADMGYRPSSDFSIDRIDNNGNYCKENCRWATWYTQCTNRRDTTFVDFDGQHIPLIQFCREQDINYQTMVTRLKSGIAFEDAAKMTVEPKRTLMKDGKEVTLYEYCGSSQRYAAVSARLGRGWSLEKALATPVAAKTPQGVSTIKLELPPDRTISLFQQCGGDRAWYNVVKNRLHNGWSYEEAFSTPPNKHSKDNLKELKRVCGDDKARYKLAAMRMNSGWTLEEALTTPKGKFRPSKLAK